MLFQILLATGVLFLLMYGRLPLPWLLAVMGAVFLAVLLLRRGRDHHHGTMVSIDAKAQRSPLNRLHAGLKLGVGVIAAFLCVAAKPLTVPLFVFVVMSAVTILGGKTTVRRYSSLLLLPMVFILLSCVAVLVEISPAPMELLDVRVGSIYLSVTAAGQATAFSLFAKALSAISCLYMISLSTPMSRIIETLRRVRLPAVVVELMYLIYRYLFILLEAHENMVNAAASRLGYRGPITSIKTTLNGSLNLFFLGLRRASDSFTAMEARCYDGQVSFLTAPQIMRKWEIALWSGFLLAVCGIWIVSGGNL